MTAPSEAPAPESVLRTLAPLLRKLEVSLRQWLAAKHVFPVSPENRATLEGLAGDLRRQAEDLEKDRPLLVVMLMGGTGVGKSTLLNALAGGAIAKASFVRPTTTDPVVYYHESVKPDRFDPTLRTCHLATHDRPTLASKIIVDAPDIDSCVLANREKVMQLLPVADVVLYVGSQEKYHDKDVWELFLEQRKRRAFAFVINKWDRCLHPGATGLRPDEDMLNDLRLQGFSNPVLFRTCAQHWVDRINGDGSSALPEGEQFPDLVNWLEMGLTRLEIEAIKAKGLSQLLEQLRQVLETTAPPDLTTVPARTRAAWDTLLAGEAEATAGVLLNTLEPYQREIEHHFTVQCHRRFRGWMAGYLNLCTRLKYLGTSLRDRLPLVPRIKGAVEVSTTWDLARFTSSCIAVAGEKHLDARGRALVNRLLVEAEKEGFPLVLLAEPTEEASRQDWRRRYTGALIEALENVEKEWSSPGGVRRLLHGSLIFLGNWLPPITLFTGFGFTLWNYFMGPPPKPEVLTVLLFPLAALLIVLILLQLLISLVLPLRWPRIRGEFHGQLVQRLLAELTAAYATIPTDRAEVILGERRHIEMLVKEVGDLAGWLEQRQQAANITGLYGN